MEFFPLDPTQTVALSLWNWDQYGQGKCMLNKYIDSFWALIEQARYPDGFQLCLTFWDSLPGGVNSFVDWASFEANFWAEFFSLDPTKTVALPAGS